LNWSLAREPRKWQIEALKAWRANDRRGVVSVVTGGGKTVFAAQCILDAAEYLSDIKTVVVVPTLALLDQWFVSIVEDLNVPASDVGTYSGEGRPTAPKPINLMVINTARQWAPIISKRNPTFLIVDECHRVGSTVNALALEGPHAATLGMSATPVREYDDAFEATVAPALGNIIYEYDFAQARRDNVVAPFDLVNVRVELTEPERIRYDAYTRRLARLLGRQRRGDDVGESLQRLLRERAAVSARAAMRVPVAVRLADQHPRSRVLIFHEHIAAAERIAELLSERGHHVTTYHSKLGPEMRRDNLRLFRQGRFDALVSCRALDEGVNVPESTVAIIASSTASSRQRIQRFGRVLRPAPGKDRALIYTIFATDLEERRLISEAESSEGADSISWIDASIGSRSRG
jgi:superfamily II DNA or RNA helicase